MNVRLDPGDLGVSPLPPTNHIASTKEALTRNITIDVLARVTYLVSRVLIPPFVLRRIGLEAYGLWSAVFLVVSYAGMSGLGLSAVYVKYVAEYSSSGETDKANSLLSTGLVTGTVLYLMLFALLLFCWPLLRLWLNVSPHLEREARVIIVIVVGVFLCEMTLSIFREVLWGCQKIAEVQIIWTVSYLSETILILILVGNGRGLFGLAEAFLIRTLISIALSIVLARRMVPWLHISLRLCSRASLRKLFNFGGIVQLGALLSIPINTIERTLAAPLIGLNAVGLLDLSDKLPQMASSIPSAFTASFFPAAAYLRSGLGDTRQGSEVIVKLYLRGARYMNLVAASATAFLATNSATILAVWIGHTAQLSQP